MPLKFADLSVLTEHCQFIKPSIINVNTRFLSHLHQGIVVKDKVHKVLAITGTFKLLNLFMAGLASTLG